MTMFSICRQLLEQGRLERDIAAMAAAEASFTREIGVLQREFFQCLQQPHLIWACTEWTHRGAHDTAAAGIMKVRRDDRVASACFRPGLYFEIFARPIRGAGRRFVEEPAGFVVVAHGHVADRARDSWQARLEQRLAEMAPPPGLLDVTVYENCYAHAEFVAMLYWHDQAAFEHARDSDPLDDEARAVSPGGELAPRTLEERLFVAAPHSDLAAYDQYECAPLELTPPD